MVEALGAKDVDPDKYLSLYEQRTVARVIGQSKTGASVLLWRNQYHVVSLVSNTPVTYNEEGVPPAIAMAVGMLKLMPVKGLIPDIGIRISDDVFFVLNPGCGL